MIMNDCILSYDDDDDDDETMFDCCVGSIKSMLFNHMFMWFIFAFNFS